MCVITIASLNHNEFNIFDAEMKAVEVDGDGVKFLGLYRRDMFGKAETEFGLSLYHIL